MADISRRRFFSEVYDSINQSNYSEVNRETGIAKTLYKGRLRFDSLLSEVLVFTDAQLLDGTFFQNISPTALDKAIGRIDGDPAPIEIRARAPSLSDALLCFVKGSDSTLAILLLFFCHRRSLSFLCSSSLVGHLNALTVLSPDAKNRETPSDPLSALPGYLGAGRKPEGVVD